MSTEPSLPPLPPLPPPHQSSSLIGDRKRAHEYDPKSSSDPPIFSSDGHLTSALEDSSQPRRKRQYRGRWWDIGASRSGLGVRKKREFKRTQDSGVWMASDESENISAGGRVGPQGHQLLNEYPCSLSIDGFKSSQDEGLRSEEIREALPPGKKQDSEHNWPAEERITSLIEIHVERGVERIDLSGWLLGCISDAMIRPLHHMVKPLRHHAQVPDQSMYEPLVPCLQLFLGHNLLRRLPKEIFCLENLTVLSLRANSLTKIPAAIGNLANLIELNLSTNRLQYLPFELIRPSKERCKSISLTLDGNRWVRPDEKRDPRLENQRRIYVHRSRRCLLRGRDRRSKGGCRFAATPVVYFDLDGSKHHSSPDILPLRGTTYLGSLSVAPKDYIPAAPDDASTHAPSLLELCLRHSSASADWSYPIDSLPEDFPEELIQLLQEAEFLQATGGQRCSICGKRYVMARTQWIEWWGCLPESVNYNMNDVNEWSPLPLLRRGCSWDCVYDKGKA